MLHDNNKLLLIFPPSWCFNVGNPHIVLPLLKSVLYNSNILLETIDINKKITEYYSVKISKSDAINASFYKSINEMNSLYFRVEDKLMSIAQFYDGEWNLQLGFKFNKYSFYSSDDIRKAITLNSPFTEYFRTITIPWLQTENPNVVGFSIASIYQIIPSLHLCWLLRREGYEGKIVFGGNTISRLKDEIIKANWIFDIVDAFNVFQGEISLPLLVDSWKKNLSLENVPNIIYRQERRIIQNEIQFFRNHNDIGTPDFTDLPIGDYWGVNCLPLLAARGCYYNNCTFCAIPFGYGGYAGTREADLVLGDMSTLSNKHEVNKFKFMDEAIPPKILFHLSKLIINSGQSFEWEGYLRLEKCWLDKSFVNQLGKSGFKKAYFGLELYPQDNRDNLGKKDSSNMILEILRNCKDGGIKVHLFCLFGFPGTNRIDAERTIDFILRYQDLIDTVDLNPFTYARHTVVEGIEKVINPHEDWALEYDYVPTAQGNMSSYEVEMLTEELEEIVWDECPRLLHPVYRLISPWIDTIKNDIKNVKDNVVSAIC